MEQHKWHKEIKAWADGAEIEQMHKIYTSGKWEKFNNAWGEFKSEWEFRIKLQPKEPQYLYIYGKGMGMELTLGELEYRTLIGKIKLEDDDNGND